MMSVPKDAAGVAAAVAAREVSTAAVVNDALERIAARNEQLNAFTAVLPERAQRRAAALDAALARGEKPGPLAGVCFGVKNLFDIEGLPTLAGARINRSAPPAQKDALVIRRLEAAGAVLLGALNMGEYACDFTGENVHDGPSRNPHDLTRQTGGSSGGSAAAVAGGLVPFALGTDTNGSIRVPASWCGIFGLKPTFGRISRSGVFPFAHSLDHVGPLAGTAFDLALVYHALTGDAVPVLPGEFPKGLRVATMFDASEMLSAEAIAAVAFAGDVLGGTRSVELPHGSRARAAAGVLTLAEAGALHLERLRTRGEDFSSIVRNRLTAGVMIPARGLLAVQKFYDWYRRRISELFQGIDLLIAPVTPGTAPPLGSVGPGVPGFTDTGFYTRCFSLAGVPAISVPVQAFRLPIGVQIVAAPGREDLLLSAALLLERAGRM